MANILACYHFPEESSKQLVFNRLELSKMYRQFECYSNILDPPPKMLSSIPAATGLLEYGIGGVQK